MKTICLYNPKNLMFGPGCLELMVKDYIALGKKRIFILTIKQVLDKIKPVINQLAEAGINVKTDISIQTEPTFADFNRIITKAKDFKPDSIAGIGGGSVMDMAKILAAFVDSNKLLNNFIGIGLITERRVHLVCAPTTSGTGSEVSPNSILLDESDNEKKGFISPALVPDATYIDSSLTLGLPPEITAYTGLDALTHCIEAYANINAHPIIDIYAINGISLISSNLLKAVKHTDDLNARNNLALGSMYGGMCLGPVNTAAVHALAYPLGSFYTVPHGLSNALLLPWVMEFNLSAAKEKYALIGRTIGLTGSTDTIIASETIEFIKDLISKCNIPNRLRELNIQPNSFYNMAVSALKVQRLLNNNLREVTLQDAEEIYKNAF